MTCQNCGEEFLGNICPKCGLPAQEPKQSPPPITQQPALHTPMPIMQQPIPMYPYSHPMYRLPKKKGLKWWHTLLIVLGVVLAMLLFTSVVIIMAAPDTEELLAKGEYTLAYNRAKENEREEILKENLVAYICKDIPEKLKDPSSFDLRKVWYDQSSQRIALEIGGKNSFGGVVSDYWYYTYSEEHQKYILFCTVSDLEEEEVNSWDDTEDKVEIILKNIAREQMKELMGNSSALLSKTSVKNINHLFENELLETVELIEES